MQAYPCQGATSSISFSFPLLLRKSGWWFFATPLKNMSSSVGMMTFPTDMEKNHVPNQTTNQSLTIINHY
jgi:hypothetical protein